MSKTALRRAIDEGWQEEDLAELGRGLRDHIETRERKRVWVLSRLRFPNHSEARLLRLVGSGY